MVLQTYAAGEHVEGENAERPPVDGFAVPLLPDDLWRPTSRIRVLQKDEGKVQQFQYDTSKLTYEYAPTVTPYLQLPCIVPSCKLCKLVRYNPIHESLVCKSTKYLTRIVFVLYSYCNSFIVIK